MLRRSRFVPAVAIAVCARAHLDPELNLGRHATDVRVIVQACQQTWTMHHHDNPRWACTLQLIQAASR